MTDSRLELRMLNDTSPVLRMIDALLDQQDQRDCEMRARVREEAPDIDLPIRNQCTGGMAA